VLCGGEIFKKEEEEEVEISLNPVVKPILDFHDPSFTPVVI